MKRLLFIGHHGGRTGAPLLLLHFLRWLKENADLPFEVLLRSGGELAAEYAALAPTEVWARDVLGDRVRRRLGLRPAWAERLRRRYPADRFPVVYSNTVANGDLVGCFGEAGRRVICHAHEMQFAIARWGGDSARASARWVREFIAASGPVKRDLMAAWNIPPEKISVIHEFGQPSTLTAEMRATHRERIRREWAVGADDLLIGMCGTTDWRKGADLFPQLARLLRARPDGRRYRLVWIGSQTASEGHLHLQRDLALLGFGDAARVVGEVPDAEPYLAALDLFTLLSREDPCPLVMLEAAALGLPVLCFDQSGGAPEFVRDDAGAVVPYLDLAALAEAIARLGTEVAVRVRMGQTGRARAMAEFTVQSQAPQLLAVIRRNLAA